MTPAAENPLYNTHRENQSPQGTRIEHLRNAGCIRCGRGYILLAGERTGEEEGALLDEIFICSLTLLVLRFSDGANFARLLGLRIAACAFLWPLLFFSIDSVQKIAARFGRGHGCESNVGRACIARVTAFLFCLFLRVRYEQRVGVVSFSIFSFFHFFFTCCMRTYIHDRGFYMRLSYHSTYHERPRLKIF